MAFSNENLSSHLANELLPLQRAYSHTVTQTCHDEQLQLMPHRTVALRPMDSMQAILGVKSCYN